MCVYVYVWMYLCMYVCMYVGVAPDRQKVMIGGMTLASDEWGKVKTKVKEVWYSNVLYYTNNNTSLNRTNIGITKIHKFSLLFCFHR